MIEKVKQTTSEKLLLILFIILGMIALYIFVISNIKKDHSLHLIQIQIVNQHLLQQIFLLEYSHLCVLKSKKTLVNCKKKKELKKYKKPNAEEKKALEALVIVLEKCTEEMQPEEIQTQIYSVGKENGYKENLRDWFRLIYEVVFGDENGPRMGFFISFFGVKETQQLIKDKII